MGAKKKLPIKEVIAPAVRDLKDAIRQIDFLKKPPGGEDEKIEALKKEMEGFVKYLEDVEGDDWSRLLYDVQPTPEIPRLKLK